MAMSIESVSKLFLNYKPDLKSMNEIMALMIKLKNTDPESIDSNSDE